MITNSECKLEEFNNCPGKGKFLKEVATNGLVLEFVDLGVGGSFKNDSATAVFCVAREKIADAYKVGRLAVETFADEFNMIKERRLHIVRLWWD